MSMGHILMELLSCLWLPRLETFAPAEYITEKDTLTGLVGLGTDT